jgi:hypothetical protein
MGILTVTVDTSTWIAWRDKRDSYDSVCKMLDWHKKRLLELWNTSRVIQDTAKMDAHQSALLTRVFKDYAIPMSSCPLRWNYSKWNGPDVFSGSATDHRPVEQIVEFRKLIPEPTALPKDQVGKKLWNKLGDYDALKDHYEKKRDVFVTLDKHDIFHSEKRPLYKKKLGLIILDPDEFVGSYCPSLA